MLHFSHCSNSVFCISIFCVFYLTSWHDLSQKSKKSKNLAFHWAVSRLIYAFICLKSIFLHTIYFCLLTFSLILVYQNICSFAITLFRSMPMLYIITAPIGKLDAALLFTVFARQQYIDTFLVTNIDDIVLIFAF